MRSRILGMMCLLVTIFLAGALASSGDGGGPTRQWAIAYLSEPTMIGLTIVQGPVLFTHDAARMARGEPCTTVSLFEPARGPAEVITAFHCIPTHRKAVGAFTVRTRPNTALGFGCVLTEYQFAGDAESHGVPTPADAH
jgi:hypothetical protein